VLIAIDYTYITKFQFVNSCAFTQMFHHRLQFSVADRRDEPYPELNILFVCLFVFEQCNIERATELQKLSMKKNDRAATSTQKENLVVVENLLSEIYTAAFLLVRYKPQQDKSSTNCSSKYGKQKRTKGLQQNTTQQISMQKNVRCLMVNRQYIYIYIKQKDSQHNETKQKKKKNTESLCCTHTKESCPMYDA
jgi:hypothetical protein